ncbi:MAG: FtsX-like permease family protein [Prolixibacteraceae bacterium]|nr:FtsX-like permease family protein [Prolixibacteraceae bacterium]
MKIAFKLAYRNLIGAGLRTWLNVIVLSFSFVVIIWLKGLMVGWDHQAKNDMSQWQIGQGQYWHNSYEPYDPFALNDSHAPIPDMFEEQIKAGEMVPMLYAQGSIYPEGRMKSIKISGIPADQTLLKIPSASLDTVVEAIPAIVGASMAHSSHLEKGSRFVMRWRDSKGTFDAAEVEIVDVFSTTVAQIDMGQVWIPLDVMQQKLLMPGEASVFSFGEISEKPAQLENFKLKSFSELTAEVDEMIKMKSSGQSVFYIILILLAMLAIFDTQVLSIFRRQKEIGTYVALGYTRREVVGLFTIEGAMHAVLAAVVAAIYGVPFFIWQAKSGFTLPMDTSEFGMTIAPTMYPVYSMGLIVSTVLIVFLTTLVVSYWPSRRIAKMNPTEALRGKIQ